MIYGTPEWCAARGFHIRHAWGTVSSVVWSNCCTDCGTLLYDYMLNPDTEYR